MNKHRALGHREMPIALVFGLHPAYEIMANFSGLHMDLWGELEMVGTLLAQDVEMVPCEAIDLTVPAHAEIVVEGLVNIEKLYDYGVVVSPSGYYLPKTQRLPEVQVQAVTMRKDRPIYRNHQTCPFTDHQVLPRLCHEAMLYNRITEIGLPVFDVRFPHWGAALSCVIQVGEPPITGGGQRCADGGHGGTLAEHQDGGGGQRGHRRRQRRGRLSRHSNPGGPSSGSVRGGQYARLPLRPGRRAGPRAGHLPQRRQDGHRRHPQVRHDPKDFTRTWPKHWGEVDLQDYL